MTTKPTISQRFKTRMDSVRSSTFIRMMRLLGKRFWPYAISLLVYSLVTAVGYNTVLAFLMKDVLDAAMNNDVDLLMRALTLALVTFLGCTPIIVAANYICSVCIKRTITDLRHRLFQHIADLPLSEFEGGHSGDLISRVTNDLAQITPIYFNLFQSLLYLIFMAVAALIAIFNIDARIGAVVLLLNASRQIQAQ